MSFASIGKSEPGQAGVNVAAALQESYACGVVVVDHQDSLTLLTPATSALLGLHSGQSASLSLRQLPAGLQRLVTELRAEGAAATPQQTQISLDEGQQLAVQASVLSPTSPATSRPVVLVLNAVAPPQQLEQALSQLNRLASLGTLSSAMAHEIKNALVAGKTLIDLLIEKNRDAELAGIVRRELGRIDAIVTGMLKLARASKAPLKPLHLHEILEHSLRLVRTRLSSTTLNLEQSLGASADLVLGSDNELQQAVMNLLLNSLDAMGPEGTLSVSTDTPTEDVSSNRREGSLRGPHIRLIIKDTGPGIAPENLERLFEPFFTTKPSGTGLGLAITRRIIEEHQGRITVQSRPGEGAAFHVLLPVTNGRGA